MELPKKARVSGYLSKYHASSEDIEKVFDIYTNIVIKINESGEEVGQYTPQERIKILERIVDDIYDAVKSKKDFIINDYTLEYLIKGKKMPTLLQFANNFRFLVNCNPANRNNCYYALANFMEYLYKKVSTDNEEYQRLTDENHLKTIMDSYHKCIELLRELNSSQTITIFNYLVGIAWYQESLINNETLIEEIGVYLYNNYVDVIPRVDNDLVMDEDAVCDEYDNILEEIKHLKTIKL